MRDTGEYLFTSESVSEGHPDKVADRISDTVLDTFLAEDPYARVACETLVTTNRPFAEWREVFPNAACVVSLVDRLVHHAEIIAIEGESYRLKEARERTEQRARQRRKAKP